MRAVILVAMVSIGCGGSGPAADDAGDDPGAITCGTETCILPASACCVAADPAMDRCDIIDDMHCDDAHPLYCDGNEDCTAGAVCCYAGAASYCTDAASCAGLAVPGAVMCHGADTAPCQAGEHCCEIVPGRPYSACSATAC